MIKGNLDTTQQNTRKGLSTFKNFFNLEAGQSPACLNVCFDIDGSVCKRLGSSSMNTVALESTGGYGMFDFGVISNVAGNDNNTKLLLHMDGADSSTTFSDSAGDSRTIFPFNNAQIDTAQSKFGGASGLFSSGAYLNVSNAEANTILLLHCDGTDASTTFIDETGKTVSAVANAQIDTAQSKFGGASALFDGTGDGLTIADCPDFNFGSSDFCVDFWFRPNAQPSTQYMYLIGQWGSAGNKGWQLSYYKDATPTQRLYLHYTTDGTNVSSKFADIATLSTATWYHIAVNRNGNNLYFFVDGVNFSGAQDITGVTLFNSTDSIRIGTNTNAVATAIDTNGWLEEIRISNKSRHTAAFTVPSGAYSTDSTDWNFGLSDFTIDTQARFNSVLTNQAMASLGVNTANYWLYSYESAPNSIVFKAYSGGSLVVNVSGLYAPNTATWYHLMVARNSTSNWYLFVNGSNIAGTGTTGGLIPNLSATMNVGLNIVANTATCFDGWLDEFRVSNLARYTANFTSPTTEYTSNLIQDRRLLCASGSGIYYSRDIGRTWAVCQTDRTATINHFSFVKDYVINTNENYDTPQFWAGTDGTYFANISTATPACKHSVAHQGYFILLNESANKTSFYYVDQNTMFSSAFSNFKLPTDRNDELTGGFSIGRNLYVSSKYKIFRMSFIGGNPDWEYVEVRNFGFIPKTIKKITIAGQGEVVIGLDWSKKLRIFTGSDDEIISDLIQRDNGITPFYLDNLNSIELNKCWAENDKNAQIYRLFLVYGGSSTVSYALNFNYRTGAIFPDDNRPYQSGIFAEDTATELYMLGCNYNGRVCVLDSGNTEVGTVINDYYTSPYFYRKTPVSVQKPHNMDLFFSVTSSGTIYYEDRTQFSNVWNLRKEFTLGSAISSLQIRQTIDIPEQSNVYQFKLSSSSNTANPWELNLFDYSHQVKGVGGV